MYPITFLTSYLLLVFCHFGATEPPPSHGYGPPSPVEFGSNEIGSPEQYSAPTDFGNFNSFSSGSPSSYSPPSSAYKSGPPSFSPHYSSSGPKYSKGGVSSSYISIVHGAGSANGPGKLRPATYSSKGPAPLNSYSAPSFASNTPFTDVKSFGGASPYSSGGSSFSGGASPYSSGEAFATNTYSKFGGSPAAYSAGGGSYESFSAGQSADYNKGYENGGVSDEVGSYSSGGPSYATFTGSSKLSYSPSFSQGSRGGSNAFSTSNVNVFGGKNSGHGNFHPPSYTSNIKPGSGPKVYSRYSGPSSFGPSSSSYSAPSISSAESGYNSRALKAGYGIENSEDFASSEDSNVYSGGFGDGAGFKVQSSYSTG